MACVGTILNPCNELMASVECDSLSYSTKAMSVRPGTSLTSCNPGNLVILIQYEDGTNDDVTYCSNNILNIMSLVSGGRLVRNKILLGILEPTNTHDHKHATCSRSTYLMNQPLPLQPHPLMIYSS